MKRYAIFLLFLGSGFCSLVYQVVWTRQLSLVFGVTTHAVSAVLGAFFLGLALGSFLAGKLADSRRVGLALYGWIEIGIGLYASIVPFSFTLLDRFYRFAHQELGASLHEIALLRFLLSGLALLVPTTLMGATLPVMTRALVRRIDSVGLGLAGLYAVNTFGAVLGVALAGFVLIGELGLARTTWIAVGGNLVIGVIAILLGRRPASSEPESQPQPSLVAGSRVGPAVARLVVLGIGLSGLASIGLEVVWTRILAMYLSSSGSSVAARFLGDFSTYAFSTILCSVLLGIVLGSVWIAPRLDRLRDPVGALAALQVLVGTSTLIAALLLGAVVPGRGEFFVLATTLLILLVPNALLGATVPLAGRIHTIDLAGLGRGIGDVYSANVLGGVLGSVLAGFVLIPRLGSQGTVMALAMVNLVVGAGLAVADKRVRTTRLLAACAPAILLFAVLFARPGVLMDGIFRTLLPHHTILFNHEEAEGMVTVSERERDGRPHRFLLIGGLLQAGDEPLGLFMHRQLAHIPLLFHADPREVLLIGLGGGTTVGAAARHANLREIDVVELVPGVATAAALFSKTNDRALEDPRVVLIAGDGRNYLQVTRKSYDIIEADIVSPRHAMATNLYSADYFRLVKSRLKPGGIVCQWFDLSLPAELYKMLLRTFIEVFPNTSVWQGGMFAVALAEGVKVDDELRDRVRERFADPDLGEALRQAGLPGPEQFLGTYLMSPEATRRHVGPGLIISDDRPYVEYFRSQVSEELTPSHVAPGWQ